MNRDVIVSDLRAVYPNDRCLWIHFSYNHSLLEDSETNHVPPATAEVILRRCFFGCGVLNDVKIASCSLEQVYLLI